MLLAMLAFGAFFLVFQIGLSLSFKALNSSLYFLKVAYSGKAKFSEFESKFKAELKNRYAIFFLDFICITSFFVIFILLSYVFYDGILRIYFFLFAFLSYLLTHKILRGAEDLIIKTLAFGFFIIFLCLSYLLIPFKAIVHLTRRLLKILLSPIKNKLKISCSNRISRKKQKEICKFLQNI